MNEKGNDIDLEKLNPQERKKISKLLLIICDVFIEVSVLVCLRRAFSLIMYLVLFIYLAVYLGLSFSIYSPTCQTLDPSGLSIGLTISLSISHFFVHFIINLSIISPDYPSIYLSVFLFVKESICFICQCLFFSSLTYQSVILSIFVYMSTPQPVSLPVYFYLH